MQYKSLILAALAVPAWSQDLATVLQNQTSLSNLTSYLGLFPAFSTQLGQLQNITLLAPNNDAFGKLLNSSGAAALTNNDTSLIEALFSYHVLNGSFSNVTNTSFIPTLLQPPQYANVTGGQVVAAVPGQNGTTFFSGLLQNASSVGQAINFTGGVIHIIDNVLTIPQNISTTAVQLNLTSAAGALTQAKLVTALDEMMDVTVFVPNNNAFQSIGSALPNLTTEQLTSILEYHVINGTVAYSTDLRNESLTTSGGSNVTIEVVGENVYVNNARVVVPNVLVSNGVVHVIDNVLNPANTTASADPSSTTGGPAFSGASSASNVPFTSGVPAPTSAVATSNAPGASSSSSSGMAAPMKTGSVGAAALFGGAAILIQQM